VAFVTRTAITVIGFLIGLSYWIGRTIGDNKGPLDRRFAIVMVISLIVLPVLGWLTQKTTFTIPLIFLGILGGSAAIILPERATLAMWPVWLWMSALLAFLHMLFLILGTLLPRRSGTGD
jgi:hypothetical protein